MNSRERIIKALRRQGPDRVPMYFEFTPYIEQIFEKKTGTCKKDYQQYFKFDMVSVEPDSLLRATSDFNEYYKEIVENDIEINEWGIGSNKGSVHHFERLIHPLNQAQTVEDIDNYPFPQMSNNDAAIKAYKDEICKAHENGLAVMSRGQCVGGTVFWPAYKLRGMEEILIDMYENEELLEALLDKITEIMTGYCCKKTECGIDVLFMADDFGTQKDLMMSYAMWERWFKKRLNKIIVEVKKINPDVIVAFHSDGNIEKIIPDLIDIGIDVLNPLQPECMDIYKIKRSYGDRLSFWGSIGTQTTMPFGTPEEVKEAVRINITEIGKGGGLLIAPTHLIEPEVPWENIMAFVEAVEEYGKYQSRAQ